ncbi:MAG: hypothetical protein RLZZ373_3256 [Pseudomonadota bacterium]|jgi:hypothetical protein
MTAASEKTFYALWLRCLSVRESQRNFAQGGGQARKLVDPADTRAISEEKPPCATAHRDD